MQRVSLVLITFLFCTLFVHANNNTANGNSSLQNSSKEFSLFQQYLQHKLGSTQTSDRLMSPNDKNTSYVGANAVTTDLSGNVFVAGSATFAITGSDFVVIKYTPLGDLEWVRRYNGSSNYDDIATAIAVDNDGNCYVTGMTKTLHQGIVYSDIATVKYSPSGEELWVQILTRGGFAMPFNLCIDKNNNVVLTGASGFWSLDHYNFMTIKYSSGGTLKWATEYDGTAYESDVAFALKTDDNCNIFVGGGSYGVNSSSDYLTIKYDSNGVKKWVAREDGPKHDLDYIFSLDVDMSQNVYVTGRTRTLDNTDDVTTIKYDNWGNKIWSKSFPTNGAYFAGDAGNTVTVGKSGNIYVSIDHGRVLKYSNSGTLLWNNLKNGISTCMLLDDNDNIFVTGDGTTKYNQEGTELWSVDYSYQSKRKLSIVKDVSGNIIVAGRDNNSFSTIKYSALGTTEWSRNYNTTMGIPTNKYIIIASDPSGSITPGYPVSVPYNGNQKFSIQPNLGIIPYKIENIYVDNTSTPIDTPLTLSNVVEDHTLRATYVLDSLSFKYRTFEYDSMLITKPIYAMPIRYTWGFKIKNTTTDTLKEIHIYMLNPVLTVTTSKPSLFASGFSNSFKLSGKIVPNEVITVSGTADGKQFPLVRKVWLGKKFGTPITSIAMDYNEPEFNNLNFANIVVDLFSYKFRPPAEFVVGIPRPDSAKKYCWVRIRTAKDFFTTMKNPSTVPGKRTHSILRRGFEKIFKEKKSLPPSTHNNLLFADILALKVNIALSSRGESIPGFGELTYVDSTNPCNGMLVKDIARKADSAMTFIKSDLSYYVMLDTTIQRINKAFSGTLTFNFLSYSPYPYLDGVKEIRNVPFLVQNASVMASTEIHELVNATPEQPLQYYISQNYPNPFNPTTSISYTLPAEVHVSLTIFNMLGQEVATLVDEVQTAGEQQISFDGTNLPSGVYMYRIKAGNFTETKRMLLIK